MGIKKTILFFSKTLLVFLTALTLASCGSNKTIKSDVRTVETITKNFDLVLHADKDNQFDLDGATLASEDLRGHLRYLQEEGRPVKQVLLKRAEKTKIKKGHLANLAVIAKELGFQAFYEEKGEIKKIILED